MRLKSQTSKTLPQDSVSVIRVAPFEHACVAPNVRHAWAHPFGFSIRVSSWLFLIAVFLMCSLISACGGSPGGGPPLLEQTASVEPEAPVVFRDATFAGKTANPDLFAAVVTHANGIEAYFCDGKKDFWFRGLAGDSVLELTEPGGASLTLEVADDVVIGQLKVGDTVTAFEIPKAASDSLYRAETYMGEQRILAGWIKLPSGEQRGTVRAGAVSLPSRLDINPLGAENPRAVCMGTACDAFAGALTPAVFDPSAATGLKNKSGHEFTVIGLGDSFMSGEGAPLTARNLFASASWSNGLPTSRGQRDFKLTANEKTLLAREARACHRGISGLTLAVEALRTTWPDNVDIIHQTFACSGAKVANLLDTRDSGPGDCTKFAITDWGYWECLRMTDDMMVPTDCSQFWVTDPRRAACEIQSLDNPKGLIKPQVNAMMDFVKAQNLKADAVVMSIGGNDLGFGDVIQDCVTPLTNCGNPDSKAQKAFELGKENLPEEYEKLNTRLKAEGSLDGSNIFLTSHPNPLRKTANSFCAGSDFVPDTLLMNLSTPNAEFGTLVHAEVNEQVAIAVSDHDWKGITSMLYTEMGHGMCTQTPWYNTRNAALATQGEDLPSPFPGIQLSAGMFHPNATGQRDGYMPAYRDALNAVLTTRFTPKTPGRFRGGQFSSDGTVTLVWDDSNDFESKTVIRNTVTNQTFLAESDRIQMTVQLNGVAATFRAKTCFTGPSGRDICSAESPAITVEAKKPTHTPQVTTNQAPGFPNGATRLAWNDKAPSRGWTTLELIDAANVVTKIAVQEQSILLPAVASGTRFRVAACNDLGCGPATPRTAVARNTSLDLVPCPSGQRRFSDGVCRSTGLVTLPSVIRPPA
jgi:hypothetical protein